MENRSTRERWLSFQAFDQVRRRRSRNALARCAVVRNRQGASVDLPYRQSCHLSASKLPQVSTLTHAVKIACSIGKDLAVNARHALCPVHPKRKLRAISG